MNKWRRRRIVMTMAFLETLLCGWYILTLNHLNGAQSAALDDYAATAAAQHAVQRNSIIFLAASLVLSFWFTRKMRRMRG